MQEKESIFLKPIPTISFPFELPLRRRGFFIIHPASLEEFKFISERNGHLLTTVLKEKNITLSLLSNGFFKLSIIKN